MYFNRTYKGGGADHDPRQKHWAEFICSSCGNVEDIDITGRSSEFDFNRVRKCPKCKALNLDDYKKNLESEIEKLSIAKKECIRKIQELDTEMYKSISGLSGTCTNDELCTDFIYDNAKELYKILKVRFDKA